MVCNFAITFKLQCCQIYINSFQLLFDFTSFFVCARNIWSIYRFSFSFSTYFLCAHPFHPLLYSYYVFAGAQKSPIDYIHLENSKKGDEKFLYSNRRMAFVECEREIMYFFMLYLCDERMKGETKKFQERMKLHNHCTTGNLVFLHRKKK